MRGLAHGLGAAAENRVGLPGEDLASFGAGFDRLHALGPHEIQVGILKRLRGAPISRHSDSYGLRFAPQPPYSVLATAHMDFPTLQRLTRFARYWDLIANSGRFAHTLPLLLGDAPFARFLQLSDWLYARTQQTHRIALSRLFELLHAALTSLFALDENRALAALAHRHRRLWRCRRKSGCRRPRSRAPRSCLRPNDSS